MNPSTRLYHWAKAWKCARDAYNNDPGTASLMDLAMYEVGLIKAIEAIDRELYQRDHQTEPGATSY